MRRIGRGGWWSKKAGVCCSSVRSPIVDRLPLDRSYISPTVTPNWRREGHESTYMIAGLKGKKNERGAKKRCRPPQERERERHLVCVPRASCGRNSTPPKFQRLLSPNPLLLARQLSLRSSTRSLKHLVRLELRHIPFSLWEGRPPSLHPLPCRSQHDSPCRPTTNSNFAPTTTTCDGGEGRGR